MDRILKVIWINITVCSSVNIIITVLPYEAQFYRTLVPHVSCLWLS